ncbi:hypothetical protein ACJX0J_030474, partial [Zea mays]
SGGGGGAPGQGAAGLQTHRKSRGRSVPGGGVRRRRVPLRRGRRPRRRRRRGGQQQPQLGPEGRRPVGARRSDRHQTGVQEAGENQPRRLRDLHVLRAVPDVPGAHSPGQDK